MEVGYSDNYKKFGGFRVQKCICDHSQCFEIWKSWVLLKDTHRCGYYLIPKFSKFPTEHGKAKNNHRDAIYFHLFGPRNYAPDSEHESKKYVAFHHFPIAFLRENNEGPVDCIHSTMAIEYGLGEHDQIRSNVSDKGHFFAVPSHPWLCVESDLREAQSKVQRLSPMEIPSPIFNFQVASLITPDARTTPEERKRCALLRHIHHDPEGMASHIEQMEKELAQTREQLKIMKACAMSKESEISELTETLASLKIGTPTKKDGLSRSLLTSDLWHSEHPKAASFLFGFATWNETKIFLTDGLFPNMEPCGAITGPLTDFEQVLITCMRMRRKYEHQTLAFIIDKSERRIQVMLDKWLPIMGRMGRFLSILYIDMNFDFISKQDAIKNNLPHSSFCTQQKYKNYFDACVPKVYEDLEMSTTGALVDGKDFTVDTIRKNSAVTRMQFSDKVDNSAARVITWTTTTGLGFEHTGIYLGRCPEIRLVELWGKEKIKKRETATQTKSDPNISAPSIDFYEAPDSLDTTVQHQLESLPKDMGNSSDPSSAVGETNHSTTSMAPSAADKVPRALISTHKPYHVQDSLCTTGTTSPSTEAESPAVPVLVLLQYPFVGGGRIEKAAEGLKHCKGLTSSEEELHDISEEKILQLQQEATGRGRFIRITTVDRNEHLEERKWLNDTIVDFWMQW